jgi:hypothetical protein
VQALERLERANWPVPSCLNHLVEAIHFYPEIFKAEEI